ncbi:F-box/LRR-repeat protein 3-like [Senna tora]|uniref:F-box/LRR-repeat protein 3-like n=1 Tax=Senna tora TaxID=362788 RepID=A0A834T040_9FABA|nr:F-box/LRR-repeat protein 3-like [Senna tora]
MKKQKSPETKNPFDLLSEELIFSILDLLAPNPLDKKSVSLVCKSFYAIEAKHRRTLTPLRSELLPSILKRYPFVTQLDLSLCARVSDNSLNFIAKSYRATLQRIDLSRSKFFSANGLSSLALNCKNLVELDLSNATELKDAAASVVAKAKNLEKLWLVSTTERRPFDGGNGSDGEGSKKVKMQGTSKKDAVMTLAEESFDVKRVDEGQVTEAGFDNEVTRIMAWVRIPSLPLEFKNVWRLCRICGLIGKTIKVDPTTSLSIRVEYEGLHMICFHCGRYRHTKNGCDEKKDSKQMEGQYPMDLNCALVAEEQGNGEAAVLEEHGGDEIGRPEIFGTWMTVTRTSRRKNQNIGEDSEHVTSQGNNEVVLAGWTKDPSEPLVSKSIDGKQAIMDKADWRPTKQFNNPMFNYNGVSGGSFNRPGLGDVGPSSVHPAVANDPTGGLHTNPIGKEVRIGTFLSVKHTESSTAPLTQGTRLVSSLVVGVNGGRVVNYMDQSTPTRLNCWGTGARSFSGLIKDLNFNFFVDFLALMETHLHGVNASRIIGFTWNRGSVAIRLDKALANAEWRNLFLEASVLHLPFYKSDHFPLLLHNHDNVLTSTRKNRPFRFMAS